MHVTTGKLTDEEANRVKAVRVRELAKLWATDPQTIYRMIREGRLAAFPLNGGLRIPLVEVRRAMAVPFVEGAEPAQLD